MEIECWVNEQRSVRVSEDRLLGKRTKECEGVSGDRLLGKRTEECARVSGDRLLGKRTEECESKWR